MHVMEFSKGSGSAIALSLAPDDSNAFAQELRQVKAALLDWRAKHGSRCEMVMLTVVTPPEYHPAIESLIAQVYREETELAPLLQAVSVRVALLNPQGKPVKKYVLSSLLPQTKSRPWWRFW